VADFDPRRTPAAVARRLARAVLVNDDTKFYAVSLPEHPQSFDGVPQFLFEMRANVFNARNSHVPSRDGGGFLVNTLLDTASGPISVIHNWLGDVK
jgi:hypothetical protein